mmetsp:Transcript_21033/g.53294  ORF Transcript_21033/g.53294 Transcript_21033/m.53294 type:complete len:163 (+) Transcript_21033:122-610(+)
MGSDAGLRGTAPQSPRVAPVRRPSDLDLDAVPALGKPQRGRRLTFELVEGTKDVRLVSPDNRRRTSVIQSEKVQRQISYTRRLAPNLKAGAMDYGTTYTMYVLVDAAPGDFECESKGSDLCESTRTAKPTTYTTYHTTSGGKNSADAAVTTTYTRYAHTAQG